MRLLRALIFYTAALAVMFGWFAIRAHGEDVHTQVAKGDPDSHAWQKLREDIGLDAP